MKNDGITTESDAKIGRGPVDPAPGTENPGAETPASVESWKRDAQRMRSLELAVQLASKGAVRGHDVLGEADRLLAWLQKDA